MDYRNRIKRYLDLEIEVIKSLDVDAINSIMNEIKASQERESTVYICGNGGSHATASHFCCDFNKGVSGEQEKNTNFVCLADNVPTITAIANDLSYDEIFSYQLKNRLKPGDIVFAISGSGNSKNVVRAMEVAKDKGNKIIGLCGFSGGKVREMSDICLHVNINNMQITEDIHMILDHVMMFVLAGYDL
ncbi:MAG: SIS domain-containing protein [Bacilli bacterium]|nr:SIS domain-containing protein [Bacilli bacterium]